MFRVFNMGIGFVLIVAPETAEDVMARLTQAGETVCRLGKAVTGEGVTFTGGEMAY